MKSLNSDEEKLIKTLEIEDILLLEAEHKVYTLFNSQELSFSFDILDDINIVVQENFIIFEVQTILKIDNKISQELLLESNAKFASMYLFKNKFDMSENEIEEFAIHFFRFSAVTHTIAYAREYFYNIISKSGYPRLTLPLMKSLVDKDIEDESIKELLQENG